jgi:ornithine cyclodeaminase/alanine dehydrogenase-like protein (mu-crystallin family)
MLKFKYKLRWKIMAKLINKELIEKSIDYKELRDEIEKYYLMLRDETVKVTTRLFSPTKDGGLHIIGGATNYKEETLITMSQPVMPWLGDEALPVANTAYLYTSFRTGVLLAVIAGADVVKYRTPAKSALAAKYLAPDKDKYTIGLIGLGIQAVTHADAFTSLFNVSRIITTSRTPDKWQENIDSIKEITNKEVEILSREDVIAQSDILIVITSSKETLVEFKDLHTGQLIIGTDHADTVAKDVVLKADKVFIDYRSTAEGEVATIKTLLDEGNKYEEIVDGDIAQLALGELKGRENNEEIIYFQSLGVLCENLAAVEYLYNKNKDIAEEIEI